MGEAPLDYPRLAVNDTNSLMRGQRDFFGAHTYKRIDKPGTFHTQWSGDRTEIAAEDTH